MRRLNKNDFNELEIFDSLSNGTIKFYHRMPTYVERIKYGNELFVKDKDGINMVPEVRVEFGALILTGFEDGSFGDPIKNLPMTAVRDNAGNSITVDGKIDNLVYCENWVEILKESVPEHLAYLAVHIFENANRKKEALEKIKINVTEKKKGAEPDFSEKK